MRPFTVRLLSKAAAEPAEADELTLPSSGPRILAWALAGRSSFRE
jgi:hypothetical protein